MGRGCPKGGSGLSRTSPPPCPRLSKLQLLPGWHQTHCLEGRAARGQRRAKPWANTCNRTVLPPHSAEGKGTVFTQLEDSQVMPQNRTAPLPAPSRGQAGDPLPPPPALGQAGPRDNSGGGGRGAVLLSFRVSQMGRAFPHASTPNLPRGRPGFFVRHQSRLPLHMEALLPAPLAKPYVSLRVQRALAGRACGPAWISRLFPICGTLRTHNTQLGFQHKKPPLPQIKHLQGGIGAFHRPFPPSREGPFSARSAASSPGTLSRARPQAGGGGWRGRQAPQS